MKPIGLYIHIPFCIKKCHYCDFVSFPYAASEVEAYVDALIKEIYLYGNKSYVIKSIFWRRHTQFVKSRGFDQNYGGHQRPVDGFRRCRNFFRK